MLLDRVRSPGIVLSGFTERWVPDSWVICMILTTIALVLAIAGAGAGVEEAVLAWGEGVWVLLSYAYGDSTTNLIQPFFAIPILAVTRLRFGDIVGYTFLLALACAAASTLAMFLIPPQL